MKTKDLLLDYLKDFEKETRDSLIREIINVWETDRGAEECEYIANKYDRNDLCTIVKSYGCEVAQDCMNDTEHQYFLIGTNFSFPKGIDDISDIFPDLVDDIAEMYEKSPENYEPMIRASEILRMVFERKII